MIYINLASEDDLSEAVMTRLLSHFGNKFSVVNTYSRQGFGYLKSNLKGFNQAAAHTPFFVLTDLDQHICPSALLNDWINFDVNSGLIFRIAVREVESWLLADIRGLATFLRISANNFSKNPDDIPDPKNELIRLAAKSRNRILREDIVPINEGAVIGPNYNGALMPFVFNSWDIAEAQKFSRSLAKTLRSL
jgi:hypothetical protein